MSRDLCKDLEELDLSARTITVKIRFFDFTTVSRARSLPCRSRDLPVIQRTARELALPLLSGKKVRLAGLRLSSLDSLDSDQKSIGDFIR
jgi:hypothetical protein